MEFISPKKNTSKTLWGPTIIRVHFMPHCAVSICAPSRMDGVGMVVSSAFAPLTAFELGRTFQWQVGTLGMGKS